MQSKETFQKEGAPAGIYIHVPFCAQLCPYCDFAVAVRSVIPHAEYAEALIEEFGARRSAGELQGRDVTTVYFGGGTPSLWSPDELSRVAATIRESGFDGVAEWTLEANPASVDFERIDAWKAAGITRISLGVQSFQDDYLSRLGRRHDGAMAARSLEMLLDAGFDTSFDLIFAGPDHDLRTWEADLEVVSELPDLHHISAYHLTIEPRTVFHRRWEGGELELPDDDVAVEMLIRLREVCRARGVEQYEVSSYAAPGKRSRHNTHYWTGSEYLGVGVGAHGLRIDPAGIVRTFNDRKLATWMPAPSQSRVEETVSPRTHLGERLFTGLRTAVGLDLDELKEQFGQAVDAAGFRQIEASLEELVSRGWVERRGARFTPTDDGFLFADSAAQIVFDPLID